MPVPDGSGYSLAKVVRSAFTGKQTLTLIDSFKEPASKGDAAVRPVGAETPDAETATPNADFVIFEEQVGIRCAIAVGDDDDAPVSLSGIVADVRRAVLRAGYVNFSFEFEALAQVQSGEKLLYVGGVVVAAQVSATLS